MTKKSNICRGKGMPVKHFERVSWASGLLYLLVALLKEYLWLKLNE